MIKVAIIDDHPVVLEWFAQAVAKTDDLILVTAQSSIAAFGRATAPVPAGAPPRPDVVVLDLSLGGDQRDGAAGVAYLAAAGLVVLVLSASDDREAVLAALQAGARGYLAKTAPTSEILTALREVAAGHHYVSPTLASYLLRASSETRALAPTAREKEILVLIATGMTDLEIAAELGISPRTVRSHLDNISGKLGQRRRAALASHAHRLGLTAGQGPLLQ